MNSICPGNWTDLCDLRYCSSLERNLHHLRGMSVVTLGLGSWAGACLEEHRARHGHSSLCGQDEATGGPSAWKNLGESRGGLWEHGHQSWDWREKWEFASRGHLSRLAQAFLNPPLAEAETSLIILKYWGWSSNQASSVQCRPVRGKCWETLWKGLEMESFILSPTKTYYRT